MYVLKYLEGEMTFYLSFITLGVSLKIEIRIKIHNLIIAEK